VKVYHKVLSYRRAGRLLERPSNLGKIKISKRRKKLDPWAFVNLLDVNKKIIVSDAGTDPASNGHEQGL